MNEDRRKRQKAKIIYDLLIARIRSEENQLFKLHEQLGIHSCFNESEEHINNFSQTIESMKEQIRLREIALGDLQHALDWYVDKLINDRRS